MARNQERTGKSITEQDIRDLRNAAVTLDDDSDTVALCDLALDGEIDMDDYTTVSRSFASRLQAMTRDEAYALCVERYNEQLVST